MLEYAAMKKLLALAALLFLLCFPMLPQTDNASGLKGGVFSDSKLDLRYTPPAGLIDETSEARDFVREKAASLHTSNTMDVLLRMTSERDDTAPGWQSVGIETYSRSNFASLDDAAAEAKLNVWVAGAGVKAVGGQERLSIAGHAFVASNFERSEPPLLKHARVYTTIHNGKLIAFAFSANSADKVALIADSLRTLVFVAETPLAYLGFDRNEYPGDQNLKQLRATFSYSSYWLNNPPGTNVNTCLGKRSKLEAAGFGFVVLFNGRLYRELGGEPHASVLGKGDAQATVAAAKHEGFPAQTIIFLDQEEGGRLLPAQKAYLFAWVDGLSQAGFRPGVYCSGIAAPEKGGASIITAEDIRQSAGDRHITYWVTNDGCPPSSGCVASGQPGMPGASGVEFAEVWQFAQSPRRMDVAAACKGYNSDGNCYAPSFGALQQLHLDLNTATSADPSHGRSHQLP